MTLHFALSLLVIAAVLAGVILLWCRFGQRGKD